MVLVGIIKKGYNMWELLRDLPTVDCIWDLARVVSEVADVGSASFIGFIVFEVLLVFWVFQLIIKKPTKKD
jgi:hypothetical protein